MDAVSPVAGPAVGFVRCVGVVSCMALFYHSATLLAMVLPELFCLFPQASRLTHRAAAGSVRRIFSLLFSLVSATPRSTQWLE